MWERGGRRQHQLPSYIQTDIQDNKFDGHPVRRGWGSNQSFVLDALKWWMHACVCACVCIHGYVSPMRWFFYCCSPFFRDYLTAKQQFDHDYVCVKYRLHKKLKVFVESELPLLLEKGYLINNIAEFRNTSKALVAQPGRGLHRYDIEKKID